MTLSDIDRLLNQQKIPRAVEMWKALQPLRSVVSFMNTGAHPDDETTSMLAAIGLRDGVKLSQACSTRGEGGQNNIGSEITKDLGVVRTREMERSAKEINMTHYWLSESPDDSIFDFGFSKSGKETLDIWGEERTLERFVHIIRRERPDIVCPTFLDISGQHGHHQAMTRAAFKAVILAADPNAYHSQHLGVDLQPWQVKKLYLPAWSGAGDAYDDDVPPPPKTVEINATGADPVTGFDYTQIAQYSRHFHATQGMGRWVEAGQENVWPLNLAWSADGKNADEMSIFDNLPRTLAELGEFADATNISAALKDAQAAIDNAIDAWPNYAEIGRYAAIALVEINQAKAQCPANAMGEIMHRLEVKTLQLTNVLALAHQIQVRVSLSENQVNAGDKFRLTVHNTTPDLALNLDMKLPDGWAASAWDDGSCEIRVAHDAAPSDPYPDTYYPDRANEPLQVVLTWKEGEQTLSKNIEPEERLLILPTHSASLSQTEAIVNLANPTEISVKTSDIYPSNAKAAFVVGEGWDVAQQDGQMTINAKKDLPEGLYELPLLLDGEAAQIIKHTHYAHTGPTNRCIPAQIKVRVMSVELPKGRIAYIGGGSDRTDFWLRKMGVEVDSLTSADVSKVDFSLYDSILIGIFAFRTCAALEARLDELHQWVETGGNLVTLYHRPWDNWDVDHTAPAFLQIGKPSLRWRVTDQNAVVTHLQPAHKLLNVPNKIGAADWQDWNKERGLYFASKWDAKYTPLLQMADPGEEPHQGILLSANIGKGRHTHTSLILHHQVEYLVPGAFRLLANLLHSE
ncbi:MAG: PIG-L family deacetylase [Rhizobiales bacterium]|nr:PIG-L family deacetylase [Hyphomicrobiales bacterium]NRB14918.1 PIG-L family deacetylase [Hyphomicrobiales bacterium]